MNRLTHNPSNSRHRSGYLYVLLRLRDGAMKVGYSINPENRATAMSAYKHNGKVVFLSQTPTGCMACSEHVAHSFLSDSRLPYEYFSGSTEWFSVDRYDARRAIQEAADTWGNYL